MANCISVNKNSNSELQNYAKGRSKSKLSINIVTTKVISSAQKNKYASKDTQKMYFSTELP